MGSLGGDQWDPMGGTHGGDPGDPRLGPWGPLGTRALGDPLALGYPWALGDQFALTDGGTVFAPPNGPLGPNIPKT